MVDTRTFTSNREVSVLPEPLVYFKDNPRAWLWYKGQMLVVAVIFAYIGVLIVAAIYYLVFETTPTMHGLWHATVASDDLRHYLRNGAEGLLGGLLAQQMIRNRYKKHSPPRWYDRLEMRLHIANVKDDKRLSLGQLLATPFLVLIYGSVGFLAAFGIVYAIRHNQSSLPSLFASLTSTTPPPNHSVVGQVEATWTQEWPEKLMGYSAAFFMGRRPAKGVFDDVQLWLVEQRIMNGRPMPRWYLPNWQAVYNDVSAHGTEGAIHHGIFPKVIMRCLMAAGFLLAVYGWYVLTIIAQ